MTPDQRDTLLQSLAAQCGGGEWWPAATVATVLGVDVLTINTIARRTIAADVARVDAVTRMTIPPTLNPAGFVAVRSYDVLAYVSNL